jgi:phenylacetate-CoA ligase
MARFWTVTETLGAGALAEFQSTRLRELVRYLDGCNPYYRALFRKLHIDASRFRGLADLPRLPFLEKKDIGGAVATNLTRLKKEGLARWHQTSGTTGDPVRFPDSCEDWAAYTELSASALYAFGVRPSDTAIAAFSYGPQIAFWSYLFGLERIGATVVAAGGMSSEARLALMKAYRVTVLLSTPSYSLHLAETARAKGVDLAKDVAVRLIVNTGEPNPPALKQQLREVWNAREYDRIGSTETGGVAFECPENPCAYHVHENFLIAEILDEADRPVAPGQDGELVITTFFRRGMPLIRFRTRNVVRRMPPGRCRCGRAFLSLALTPAGVVLRRLDDLVKIRGMLLSPTAISSFVQEQAQVDKRHELVFHTVSNVDEVTLRVEALPGAAEVTFAGIARELQQRAYERFLMRFNVEVLRPHTLPAKDKAQTLIDRRVQKFIVSPEGVRDERAAAQPVG